MQVGVRRGNQWLIFCCSPRANMLTYSSDTVILPMLYRISGSKSLQRSSWQLGVASSSLFSKRNSIQKALA